MTPEGRRIAPARTPAALARPGPDGPSRTSAAAAERIGPGRGVGDSVEVVKPALAAEGVALHPGERCRRAAAAGRARHRGGPAGPAIALILFLAAPAEAAHCRLSPDGCQAVDRELAAERDAADEDGKRTRGLEPRAALAVLADLKVRRMVARARALPKPVAKEFLRIAACDLDAEVARNGGTPSSGDCE